MPSVDGTARGLRDRALGKAAILVAVLVAAFLVSRSCGETKTELSQDEAVSIARTQVAFEPNDVRVRLQRDAFRSREFWLVGLGVKRADGSYEQAVSVRIDADTGEVVSVGPAGP